MTTTLFYSEAEHYNKEVDKALNILLRVEDKTGYRNKPLSKCINLLQKVEFKGV
jgi:hypothetical protein